MAEAKGLRPNDHLFPGGSAWLEHKFLEVLGSTPWRHCRWHSLRRGGNAACYTRDPQMQFFLWWGRWRSVGTALQYAMAFQDAAVVGPLRLPAEAGARGATRVLTHLEVWAPNMYPSEAEPLPPAAFHPPAWPEDLLPPPPPPLHPKLLGGRPSGRSGAASSSTRPPPPSADCPAPPDPGERGGGGASLLSTPVTVPGLREGGVDRGGPGGQGPLSPSDPTSGPQRPVLSSEVAVGREGTRGSGRLHARCSKRGGGSLEWWAVPCVYRRARLARRWRWVLQRRGEGLMPSGLVWLGVLEWPEPEPRLARQRSAGGSAQRSRRRRARRPPDWLTLRGLLQGPEDLFAPPPPLIW